MAKITPETDRILPDLVSIANNPPTEPGRQTDPLSYNYVLYPPLRQREVDSLLQGIMARSFNKEKTRDKNIRTYELNRHQPKVLIVEENKISLVYLSEILKQRKIETDLAPNGALAIRMAKKRRVMTTLAAVV